MTIADYITELGATVRGFRSGWQKIRCPFHDDRQPSASVNVNEDRFKCFACDINEDLIGLIMLREGATYAEAKQKAAEDFGKGDDSIRTELESSGLLPVRPRNRSRNGSGGETWRGEFT